jgi:hypothetical protein
MFRLGNAPLALNTVVTNVKGTEKCYAQCGKFYGQSKGMKQSPFQKQESCWMCGLNKLQPAVQ